MRQHSAQYSAYLESDRWHALRAEVVRRAGYRCKACGGGGVLDVHHARGYRNLGRERADELQALCRDCHDAVHARVETNPFGCVRTLMWVALITIAIELVWWLLVIPLHQAGVF
jgi:5-methylcytosine-specific restriction endonuclease McrA